VQYLHRLVGRAHNQLYRARRFQLRQWGHVLLREVPRSICQSRPVQLAFLLFWVPFLLCAYLAAMPHLWPNFAEEVVGRDQLEALTRSHATPFEDRGAGSSEYSYATSMYLNHNTTIGLKCFAGGLLIVPGIYVTLFNATKLGAAFGYVSRPDNPARENFFMFTTAHGPTELTAIVLAAGAGLSLGLALFFTNGRTRLYSLREAGRRAMPIVALAVILFMAAAIIEGFLSNSQAGQPIRTLVAVLSTTLLLVYIPILGYPWKEAHWWPTFWFFAVMSGFTVGAYTYYLSTHVPWSMYGVFAACGVAGGVLAAVIVALRRQEAGDAA